MHYNILDEKRKNILPLLANFKEDFYLAGGTALALQLGHRDSIDFDFFSENDFDSEKLFEKIESIFSGFKISKTQDEQNTLSVVIDETIKLSFFTYKYKLLSDALNEEYIRLASILDIACMKLSAIVNRATNKDYTDLYFILKLHKLEDLLNLVVQKYKNMDVNLVLKSLVYFDDIKQEPIVFKEKNDVSWEEVRNRLQKEVFDLKAS